MVEDDVTLSEPLHELNEQLAEQRGEEYDREAHEQEVRELVEAAPAPSEILPPLSGSQDENDDVHGSDDNDL